MGYYNILLYQTPIYGGLFAIGIQDVPNTPRRAVRVVSDHTAILDDAIRFGGK